MDKIVTYLRAPLFVWWDITYQCNLRCKHCYSNSGLPANNELATDEVRKIIDQLVEMKVFYIYFLGGEPFIRKDFLEIADHCRELGMSVMVNTNGWFIDYDLARKIKKVGIHHIRVSIDGATAATHDRIRGVKGSFQKALSAIEALKKVEVPVIGISPTVMKENFSEAPLIIDLAFKHGVSEIQLVQLCSTGRGKQVKSISIEQLKHLRRTVAKKKEEYFNRLEVGATPGILEECLSCTLKQGNRPTMIGCLAGRGALNISPEGLTMPCLLDRKVIGNLRQISFKEIWEKAPEILKRRIVKGVCLTCEYQDICSRECPVEIKSERIEMIRECFIEKQKGGVKNYARETNSCAICVA